MPGCARVSFSFGLLVAMRLLGDKCLCGQESKPYDLLQPSRSVWLLSSCSLPMSCSRITAFYTLLTTPGNSPLQTSHCVRTLRTPAHGPVPASCTSHCILLLAVTGMSCTPFSLMPSDWLPWPSIPCFFHCACSLCPSLHMQQSPLFLCQHPIDAGPWHCACRPCQSLPLAQW